MIEAERGKEGLEESKKTRNNIGRLKLEKEKLLIALRIYNNDQYSIKEIIEETMISRESPYRAINKRKLEETKK
ncbi:recombinase family protein [Bacillus thuringiensis]|uniref:recombinase family protein n=1 Tax=Bacillus thuringiensis TaxID=1428 RepID=UPI0030185F0B